MPGSDVRMAVAFARGMSRSPTSGWCEVCADFLDVSGAAITIMTGEVAAPMCASNAAAGSMEDAQLIAGEGPSHDAFRFGRSVHVPALDGSTSARWPTFGEAAAEHGIGAAFAYPLATAGASVGVLSLYHTEPGSLTLGQSADAMSMVQVLTEAVLSLQDDAPTGSFAPVIDHVVAYRAEIYQASGIVAVQLGIGADEALARLRAYAFARDTALDVLASAIVEGRLRLDDDEDDAPTAGVPR